MSAAQAATSSCIDAGEGEGDLIGVGCDGLGKHHGGTARGVGRSYGHGDREPVGDDLQFGDGGVQTIGGLYQVEAIGGRTGLQPEGEG